MDRRKCDAETLLKRCIYEYMVLKNLNTSAELFKEEAELPIGPEAFDGSPSGFLSDWWLMFWDVYQARQANHGRQQSSFENARKGKEPLHTSNEKSCGDEDIHSFKPASPIHACMSEGVLLFGASTNSKSAAVESTGMDVHPENCHAENPTLTEGAVDGKEGEGAANGKGNEGAFDEKDGEEAADENDEAGAADEKCNKGAFDEKDREEAVHEKDVEGGVDKKNGEGAVYKNNGEAAAGEKDGEESVAEKDGEGAVVEKDGGALDEKDGEFELSDA